MAKVAVEGWQCEYLDCEHVWIAMGDQAPARCAKCKRGNWHERSLQDGVRGPKIVDEPIALPVGVKRGLGSLMPARKPVQSAPVVNERVYEPVEV